MTVSEKKCAVLSEGWGVGCGEREGGPQGGGGTGRGRWRAGEDEKKPSAGIQPHPPLFSAGVLNGGGEGVSAKLTTTAAQLSSEADPISVPSAAYL